MRPRVADPGPSKAGPSDQDSARCRRCLSGAGVGDRAGRAQRCWSEPGGVECEYAYMYDRLTTVGSGLGGRKRPWVTIADLRSVPVRGRLCHVTSSRQRGDGDRQRQVQVAGGSVTAGSALPARRRWNAMHLHLITAGWARARACAACGAHRPSSACRQSQRP